MRPVFAPLLALLIVHQAHSFENPTDFPYQANVGKDMPPRDMAPKAIPFRRRSLLLIFASQYA